MGYLCELVHLYTRVSSLSHEGLLEYICSTALSSLAHPSLLPVRLTKVPHPTFGLSVKTNVLDRPRMQSPGERELWADTSGTVTASGNILWRARYGQS